MIDINLAPWRKYQRLRSARLFLLWLVMGSVVICMLLAIADQYLQQALEQQSSQRVSLEKRMATHQQAIEELAAEAKLTSKILQRAAELKSLLAARFHAHQILLALAHSVPDAVRYVEVDLSAGGLTIVGIARSNQLVAQLIDAVSDSALDLSMQLVSAESSSEKGGDLGVSSRVEGVATPVRFEIYAQALESENYGVKTPHEN